MSAKIKSPWAVDAAVVVVVCNSQTYALSFSLPLSLSPLPPFLIPLLGWLIVAASASSCRLLFVGLAKIMRIRCGFSAGQTARSPFILSLSLSLSFSCSLFLSHQCSLLICLFVCPVAQLLLLSLSPLNNSIYKRRQISVFITFVVNFCLVPRGSFFLTFPFPSPPLALSLSLPLFFWVGTIAASNNNK